MADTYSKKKGTTAAPPTPYPFTEAKLVRVKAASTSEESDSSSNATVKQNPPCKKKKPSADSHSERW